MDNKIKEIEQFINTGIKLNKEHWQRHDELTKNRIADLSGDMLTGLQEWMSSIKIYTKRNLENHPLYDDINAVIFHNKNKIADYEKMMGLLKAILKDLESLEENNNDDIRNTDGHIVINESFKRLPNNIRLLLKDIVNSENPTEMICSRLENGSSREKNVLKGILRELINGGYIEILWADNKPHYIQINNSAITYEEQEEKYELMREVNNADKKLKEYDVFISHANSDKNDYVNHLVETIKKLGINIFYDKDILSWGDNWKEIILSGTEKSEFAVIVISESFFDREWTEIELSEFLQRQNKMKQKTVLPLLHNITFEQFKNKYPALQYIQGIRSSDYSPEQIAILLAKELIKRYK